MHKLLVLYPEPADREAFERHYRDVHLPLCAKMPGLIDVSFSLGIDGGPYFAVFEATFSSGPALEEALGSPEGQAVQADVPNYATGGAVVVTFADEAFALA